MSQCVTTLLFQVFEHIRHDVPWPHECQLSTTPHRHHARHNVRRWLRRSWWRHCIPTVTNIERQTDNTSPQMSWFIHYTSPQMSWLINSASLQMMILITQIHWYHDSYTTQIHRLHDFYHTCPFVLWLSVTPHISTCGMTLTAQIHGTALIPQVTLCHHSFTDDMTLTTQLHR